jgi:hypothetical protein
MRLRPTAEQVPGFATDIDAAAKVVRAAILKRFPPGPERERWLAWGDNLTFGPALLDAYHIESKESFYPRIIVSTDVLNALADEEGDDGLVIDDRFGRKVLNPFWLGFQVINPDFDQRAVESFESLNRHLTGIKPLVEANIRALEEAGRFAHAEKWHYMQRLLGDGVGAQCRGK